MSHCSNNRSNEYFASRACTAVVTSIVAPTVIRFYYIGAGLERRSGQTPVIKEIGNNFLVEPVK